MSRFNPEHQPDHTATHLHDPMGSDRVGGMNENLGSSAQQQDKPHTINRRNFLKGTAATIFGFTFAKTIERVIADKEFPEVILKNGTRYFVASFDQKTNKPCSIFPSGTTKEQITAFRSAESPRSLEPLENPAPKRTIKIQFYATRNAVESAGSIEELERRISRMVAFANKAMENTIDDVENHNGQIVNLSGIEIQQAGDTIILDYVQDPEPFEDLDALKNGRIPGTRGPEWSQSHARVLIGAPDMAHGGWYTSVTYQRIEEEATWENQVACVGAGNPAQAPAAASSLLHELSHMLGNVHTLQEPGGVNAQAAGLIMINGIPTAENAATTVPIFASSYGTTPDGFPTGDPNNPEGPNGSSAVAQTIDETADTVPYGAQKDTVGTMNMQEIPNGINTFVFKTRLSNPYNLRVSFDGGLTWVHEHIFESGNTATLELECQNVQTIHVSVNNSVAQKVHPTDYQTFAPLVSR